MSYESKISVALLIALLVCAPAIAQGINFGGGTEVQLIGENRASEGITMADSSGVVTDTISGTGDVNQNLWVQNVAGALVQIDLNIEGATAYAYSSTLIPGEGGGWDDPIVSASVDSLNVPYANAIFVQATAGNPEADGYYAEVSSSIINGSLQGYSSKASASATSRDAAQNFDSASAYSFIAWAEAMNAYEIYAEVESYMRGTLQGYSSKASTLDDSALAIENCHINGSFESTASASDAPDKTRNSNYGTDYDLYMEAIDDSSGSTTSGVLGYYINPNMNNLIPGKGAIEGAIYSAESGDTINLAEGTYDENIVIDKTLTLSGAGRNDDQTVIRAALNDEPVIWVASNNTTVRSLQVTGAIGAPGIFVGYNDVSHVTLDDMKSKDNRQGLFIYALGNKISDINADGIVISGSMGDGVDAWADLSGTISGLSLNNAQISGSGKNGVVAASANRGTISGISLDNAKIVDSYANGVYTDVYGGSISDISLDNTIIDGSGMMGVYAYAYGGSINDISMTDAVISSSGEDGVNILADIGGSISNIEMNGVSIADSGHNGVYVNALKGSISDINIDNALISRSGYNGMHADASDNGAISGLSLNNAQISGSGGDGVNVWANNYGMISGLSLYHAQVINSESNGVIANAVSGGSISDLDLQGATISLSGKSFSDRKKQNGVYLEADGTDSSITNVNLNSAYITDSRANGLYALATNGGSISGLSLDGATISENGIGNIKWSGIFADAQGDSTIKNIYMNGGNLISNGGGMHTKNVGNVRFDGINIYNNSEVGVWNSGTHKVYVTNSWWGYPTGPCAYGADAIISDDTVVYLPIATKPYP